MAKRYSIEIDEDQLERQIEQGVQFVEDLVERFGQSLEQHPPRGPVRFAATHVKVERDDDEDEDKQAKRRQERSERSDASPRDRRHKRSFSIDIGRASGPPERQYDIPKETGAEFAARFLGSFVDPGPLFTFGGMLIAAIMVGLNSNVGLALLAGGVVFYLALVSATFTDRGFKREKRLRRLAKRGELPLSPDPEAPRARQRFGTPETVPASRAEGLVQSLESLIERMKVRHKDNSALIDLPRLERHLATARGSLAKHAEVAAYLASVGGSEGSHNEAKALQRQLDDLEPADPRRASLQNLLTIKERTASNLRALEEFLGAVEGKLAEQVAQLESYDSALLRHSLGSYQEVKQFDDALFEQEITVLSEGLDANDRAMESEMRALGKQLV